MTLRNIFGEAWRNLNSGTSRALLGLVLLMVLATAIVGLDGRATRQVLLDQRALRDAGAATLVLNAAGMIDGERCLRLGEVAGVTDVFVARSHRDRISAAALPDSSWPAHEIAGDALALFGGEVIGTHGILLSSAIADQLQPTQQLELTSGPVGVRGVFNYPDDGRNSQLAAAVLLPVSAAGTFDSCWVAIWPVDNTLETVARTAINPGASEQSVEVAYLNQSQGRPTTAARALANRPTATIAMITAGLGAPLGFVLVRRRRIELALGRHLGQSLGAQVAQVGVETLTWVAATVAAGCALALVTTSDLTTAEAHWVFWHSAANVLAAGTFTVAGALLAVVTVRVSRLNTWAKDR